MSDDHGPGPGGSRGLPDDDTDLGKYSLSNMITERLPDGVALSQHATHRYRERTPHDCQVALETAFCAGDDLAHPVVAAKLGGMLTETPTAVGYTLMRMGPAASIGGLCSC